MSASTARSRSRDGGAAALGAGDLGICLSRLTKGTGRVKALQHPAVPSLVAGIAASLAAATVTAPAPEKAPRFAFPVDGRARIGMEEAQRFGGARDHGGQDVFARCGTPVVAAHGGRVRRATFEGAAGNYVVVDGRGGRSFVYMHLRRPSRFREGDAVRLPSALRDLDRARLVPGPGDRSLRRAAQLAPGVYLT
jgi:murein DD-endopeptidase MepM/ murein hydrolase activator NlpD